MGQIVPRRYLYRAATQSIIAVRKAKSIGPVNKINMDQTMCRFDMSLNQTNNKKGMRTVRIKSTRAEKGFTIALTATAVGMKLPAVIVFKERG